MISMFRPALPALLTPLALFAATPALAQEARPQQTLASPDGSIVLTVSTDNDGEAVLIFVGQRADAFEEQRNVGMRLVVDLLLEIERPGARLVRRRRRWIVAQFGVVHRKVDRVDAKPVNPALQPEAHDTQQRVLHVAVVDVELRLRAEEIMEIILAAPRVPRPGRAAEHRLPVGRRRPVGPGKIGSASCRERVCQYV